MSTTRAYFHEDDYGQIEILPAQNWEHCANELGKISEFSNQHRAPDGVGWTSMYMRGESPKTLASLNINFESFCSALAQRLPKFDRVETGYSSFIEECQGTNAFGFEQNYLVFVSKDEAQNISNIWLSINATSESQQQILLSAFREIEKFGEFLFVDWGWESLFFLREEIRCQQYLQERTERMQAFYENMIKERSTKIENPKVPWWRFWG
jgi:hypothetical protein